MANLVISGDSSGSVTLSAPAVSGTTVLTLPTTSGTLVTTAGGSTVPFALGTVSAPSITFTGDTNTGIYSPAADTIAFTEGGVESMRIDSSGRVLIGATSPALSSYALISANAVSFNPLVIKDTGTTYNTSTAYALFGNSSDAIAGFVSHTEATGIGLNSASNLIFCTNTNTERMRIDSSGNVGIGSPPSSRFSVIGGSLSTSTYNLNIATGLTTGRAGTYQSGSLSAIHTYFDETSVELSAGSSNGWVSAVSVTGNGASTYAGTIRFSTISAERMRITSGGDVLMGKTVVDDTTQGFAYRAGAYVSLVRDANPALYLNRLSSDGRIQEFARSNTIVGNISVTTSATAYNTSSDYRLKENIAPMTGALDKISALKPVTYKWKVDGSASQGFIAHELQEVVPDCVTGEKDAVDAEGKPVYQGIDTSFLVATLTAAIKEQQALITQLQADVAALKGAK